MDTGAGKPAATRGATRRGIEHNIVRRMLMDDSGPVTLQAAAAQCARLTTKVVRAVAAVGAIPTESVDRHIAVQTAAEAAAEAVTCVEGLVRTAGDEMPWDAQQDHRHSIIAAAQDILDAESLIPYDGGVNGEIPQDTRGTALHVATHERGIGVVRALLHVFGANPNTRNMWGHTPIFTATCANEVDILVAAGADPCARSKDGDTALHWVRAGEAVRSLVAHGLSVDSPCSSGRTPLFIQVSESADVSDKEESYDGTIDAVTALLKLGADPNIARDDGDVPLHWATHVELVDLLVKYGANAWATNKKGETPANTQDDGNAHDAIKKYQDQAVSMRRRKSAEKVE